MRKKLSIKEYVIDSISWNFIMLALYSTLFFEGIKGLDIRTSYLILIVMEITSCFVHTIITINWRMNRLGAISGAIIPLGVYTYIAYREKIPGLLWLIAFVALFGIVNLCLIMKSELRTRTLRKKINIKVKLAFLTTRWLATFTTIFLVLYVSCYQYLVNYPDASGNTLSIEEFKAEDHMDTIELLSSWSKLTCEQRKDAIQVFAKIEASNLGCYQDFSISFEYIWDDDRVLGYFDGSSNTVVISKLLLYEYNPKKIITTLAHEMKHLEQHRIYEIYRDLSEADKELNYFEKGAVYEKEFTSYISGRRSYDEEVLSQYYNQTLEVEARGYQQERWEYYCGLLGDPLLLTGYYRSSS